MDSTGCRPSTRSLEGEPRTVGMVRRPESLVSEERQWIPENGFCRGETALGARSSVSNENNLLPPVPASRSPGTRRPYRGARAEPSSPDPAVFRAGAHVGRGGARNTPAWSGRRTSPGTVGGLCVRVSVRRAAAQDDRARGGEAHGSCARVLGGVVRLGAGCCSRGGRVVVHGGHASTGGGCVFTDVCARMCVRVCVCSDAGAQPSRDRASARRAYPNRHPRVPTWGTGRVPACEVFLIVPPPRDEVAAVVPVGVFATARW